MQIKVAVADTGLLLVLDVNCRSLRIMEVAFKERDRFIGVFFKLKALAFIA
jgi:hypothetical protein